MLFRSFKLGQVREVLGHRVQYLGLVGDERPEKRVTAAKLVLDGDEYFPAQNFYTNQREAVASPAIQYTVLGDLYTVFIQADETDQSAVIKFISSPLVSWIWVGGLILVIGSALTLIPSVVAESRVKVGAAAASD